MQLVKVRVPSMGKRLPLGLASSYSESYPSDLVGVLGEEEWHDIITRFNHTLLTYWPCDLCFFGDIFCAPCSLGLSLIAPTRCLTEVEEQANEFLYRVSNRPNFYDKKICFSLEYDWCRSDLVITFLDHLSRGTPAGHRDIESYPSTTPSELKKMY